MSESLKHWGADTFGPLNSPMKDEFARKQEELLETGEYTHVTLSKADSFEAFIEREKADISIISDDSIDRDGHIIDQKTIDFDTLGFRKNPIVSYNHNYDIPPVGKSLWQKTSNGVTRAKTQYISRPSNLPNNVEWFPDSLFHMIKAGVMRAKSIGSLIKFRALTKEDVDKNPHWKDGKKVSEKTFVFEYCVCPLGINTNAVVEMISKSLITIPEDILYSDFSEVADKVKDIHNYIRIKNEIPIIRKSISIQQMRDERKQAIQKVVKDYMVKTPNLIEDTIKRAMGRVE